MRFDSTSLLFFNTLRVKLNLCARSHIDVMSRQLRTLGPHVDGVERLAGGHEQAVLLRAAETKIGASFRKMDFAD